MSEEHRKPVLEILNYYMDNTCSIFPEEHYDDYYFSALLEIGKAYPAYVAKSESGIVMGMAMLSPYDTIPQFARTAKTTYFILPQYTNLGIGKSLLKCLIEEAGQIDVDCLLANIAAENDGSIRFHEQNGFVECGRFVRAGKRGGNDFDIVWMQKLL